MKPKKNIPETIDVESIELNNVDCEDDNIEVLGSQNSHSITMYLDSSVEDGYFKKFIKATEKVVRSNADYKSYLEYLREEEGLNTCAIFHNVVAGDATIELHHFPFTLYTICSIIANDLMAKGDKVSTFYLADKVITEHMNNIIGLVPLTVTVHELAHLGKIMLLKKHIYGDYNEFFTKYNKFFTDGEKAFIDRLNTTNKIKLTGDIIDFLEFKT